MPIIFLCASPVTSSKIIIIFNVLFLFNPRILLKTRNQRDMLLLHKVLVFSCHLHYRIQSCWRFLYIIINTLCTSFLNLFCGFNIVLLFSRHSLKFLFLFCYTLICSLCFLLNTSLWDNYLRSYGYRFFHYFSNQFIFHQSNYFFVFPRGQSYQDSHLIIIKINRPKYNH